MLTVTDAKGLTDDTTAFFCDRELHAMHLKYGYDPIYTDPEWWNAFMKCAMPQNYCRKIFLLSESIFVWKAENPGWESLHSFLLPDMTVLNRKNMIPC